MQKILTGNCSEFKKAEQTKQKTQTALEQVLRTSCSQFHCHSFDTTSLFIHTTRVFSNKNSKKKFSALG